MFFIVGDGLRLKKFFTTAVILFLFTGTLSLFASATEHTHGMFTYTLNGSFAQITSCTATYKNRIIIPKTIDGYSVKSIAEGAFYGNEYLTELYISQGVEEIGSLSFYMCPKLEKVYLPESISKIGENAFAECIMLGEIILSENVSEIGENAFSSCSKISVSDKNSVFSTDENGVLFNKNKTVLLQYPSGSDLKEYNIPQTVKKIEERAFYKSKNLRRVTFPNGLISIEKNAFEESGILRAEIPESVKEIGECAFSRSQVSFVKLPQNLKVISERLFYVCLKLEKIEVGEKVQSIEDEAFFGCENLNEFDIPKNVLNIGKGSFFLCKSLFTAVVPQGVESIKDNTFYGSGLRTITLPQSIKSIGEEAFFLCDSLEKVIFGASKEVWEEVFVGENNEVLHEAERVYRDFDIEFSIKEPSSNCVKYGETLVLYIEKGDIPKESRIVWRANGDNVKIQQSIDGTACHVTPVKSGKCAVFVSILNDNGETAVNSDGRKMISVLGVKSKMNFFAKAISFIKNLFGLTRYVF